MTTIAYSRGVMASDSGAWMGDASHGWAEKLARGPDGTLHGVAGAAAECFAYLDWVKGGYVGEAPRPRTVEQEKHSFIVLVVPRSGPLRVVTSQGDEVYDAPYFAIGAGAPTAFGALFAGATAEQAIAATVAHGSGAFGSVKAIRHEDAPFLAVVAAE